LVPFRDYEQVEGIQSDIGGRPQRASVPDLHPRANATVALCQGETIAIGLGAESFDILPGKRASYPCR
jgi:hypothetical protein